jgi:Tfp pilus assembly protein PilW
MKRAAIEGGLTLIELLLYVVIVGLLLLSLAGMYAEVLGSRVKSQSIAEVNQQGQQAMDTITQTIRNATAVTAPGTAASGATLMLTTPASTYNPSSFFLLGNALQVSGSTGAPIALTGPTVRISSLEFRNLTNGTNTSVQISFVVSNTNNLGLAGSYQKTFISSAEVGL